jgi:hypothetical protein
MFVDESERKGYLLAVAVLAPEGLARVRSTLRGLRLPGERRLHFQAESEQRRRKILVVLAQQNVDVHLYTGRGRSERVRESCLRRLVDDAVKLNVQRLVLESRGAAPDRHDRRVIAESLRRNADPSVASPPTFVYEHLQAHEEPILWISDAVAWCYGAGGQWRVRVSTLIERIVDLGRQ